MITKGEPSYNVKTFQVEFVLIHSIKMTQEWINLFGKEDLIKIMTEMYSNDLEKYFSENMPS